MAGQPEELVDLLDRLTRLGWPNSRIAALRNTCAAAATKPTLSEADRELARAIAAALSGTSAGVSATGTRIGVTTCAFTRARSRVAAPERVDRLLDVQVDAQEQ
jgi:hypothetical protein